MAKKRVEVTIEKDEFIYTCAQVLTDMTLKNPAIILIADEFSTFSALVVKALFEED